MSRESDRYAPPSCSSCCSSRQRPAPRRRAEPVTATIETTLTTRDAQIRQLAFDGDEASFFESTQPPGAGDHFTLVLDRPVRLRSIAAVTGRADGGDTDAVRSGTLEVSADGSTFRELARFAGGTARGGPADGPVRAIRIKPGPAAGPIAIRELTIDSDPPVAAFRYPVEFVVDTADAPDLKPWAESAARACRARLCDDQRRAGQRWLPPAAADLAGAVGDVPRRGQDVRRPHRRLGRPLPRPPPGRRATVHETVHVAQGYPMFGVKMPGPSAAARTTPCFPAFARDEPLRNLKIVVTIYIGCIPIFTRQFPCCYRDSS